MAKRRHPAAGRQGAAPTPGAKISAGRNLCAVSVASTLRVVGFGYVAWEVLFVKIGSDGEFGERARRCAVCDRCWRRDLFAARHVRIAASCMAVALPKAPVYRRRLSAAAAGDGDERCKDPRLVGILTQRRRRFAVRRGPVGATSQKRAPGRVVASGEEEEEDEEEGGGGKGNGRFARQGFFSLSRFFSHRPRFVRPLRSSLPQCQASWVPPASSGCNAEPPTIEAVAAHPLLPRVAVATSDKLVRVLELVEAPSCGLPASTSPVPTWSLAELASTAVPKRPSALAWVPPGARRLSALRAAVGPAAAARGAAPRALLVGDKFGDVYLCEQERRAGGGAHGVAEAARPLVGLAEAGAAGEGSLHEGCGGALPPLFAGAPLLGHYNSTLGALDATEGGSLVASADKDGKVRVTRVLREGPGPGETRRAEGRPPPSSPSSGPSPLPLPQLRVIRSFCLGHDGNVRTARFLPIWREGEANAEKDAEKREEEEKGEDKGDGTEAKTSSVSSLPVRLVTGGEDGTVRLWDALSGAELDRVPLELALGSSTVREADCEPTQGRADAPAPGVAFAEPFSATGTCVAAAVQGDDRIAVFAVVDRTDEPTPHPGDARARLPRELSKLALVATVQGRGRGGSAFSPSAASRDAAGKLWVVGDVHERLKDELTGTKENARASSGAQTDQPPTTSGDGDSKGPPNGATSASPATSDQRRALGSSPRPRRFEVSRHATYAVAQLESGTFCAMRPQGTDEDSPEKASLPLLLVATALTDALSGAAPKENSAGEKQETVPIKRKREGKSEGNEERGVGVSVA